MFVFYKIERKGVGFLFSRGRYLLVYADFPEVVKSPIKSLGLGGCISGPLNEGVA